PTRGATREAADSLLAVFTTGSRPFGLVVSPGQRSQGHSVRSIQESIEQAAPSLLGARGKQPKDSNGEPGWLWARPSLNKKRRTKMGRGTGATVSSHPKLDSIVHRGAISTNSYFRSSAMDVN